MSTAVLRMQPWVRNLSGTQEPVTVAGLGEADRVQQVERLPGWAAGRKSQDVCLVITH